MHTTIYSLCFVYFFLILSPFVHGGCLSGQNDSGFTYEPSDYVPVVYEYSPSSPKPENNNESSLTFFSWNIQSNYDLSCKQILPEQIEFMDSINAHFYGLQETDIDVDIRCNCNMPQQVANGVGFKSYFMQMFPWRTGKYGTLTAFGYVPEETLYLYYTVVPNFERRGVLAHLVSPPQLNGNKMWYLNTHMEQSSLDVRMSQVADLKNWVKNTLLVKEPNAFVMVGGDFYTVPGDTSYASMREYFDNAWEEFNGSPAGGFTHLPGNPQNRFDHFYFKNSATVQATITKFTIPNNLLADHLSIVATVKFTTSGTAATTGASSTSSASSTTSASTTTTGTPTVKPTSAPTNAPTTTSTPTNAPTTSSPTSAPTNAPTTSSPTSVPTNAPTTSAPTTVPTNSPTNPPTGCSFQVYLSMINAWNSSTASNVQYRMHGKNIGVLPLRSFKFRITLSDPTSTIPAYNTWNFVQDTALVNGVMDGHASLWYLPIGNLGGDTGFVVATPLPRMGYATVQVIC